MKTPVFNSRESELDQEIHTLGVGSSFVDDNNVLWTVIYDDPTYIEHRWYYEGLIVVGCDSGEQVGHLYLNDKSESQDGQFNEDEYWFGPYEPGYSWHKVKGKQVTTWTLV